MQVAAILARAHAATHLGIRYKLGAGGFKPGLPTPGPNGQCDCSGFVAWCLGLSRQTSEHFYKTFNGGWIETTAVWTDIGSSAGIFEPSELRPGAVVVYPDGNNHQGHIGIVVDPAHVIHCSMGNDRSTGNAIQMTAMTVFQNNDKSRHGWLHGLS